MNKKGFTLIEIIIGILITSIVIIGGFQAFTSVYIGKISLMEKAKLQNDSFYFSTKLYDLVKKGGLIDYEEYFNRKVVGNSLSGGYYELETGYGNYGYNGIISSASYGSGFYFCTSSGTIFSGSGCISDNNISSFNTNSGVLNIDYTGSFQRYGQYSFQFIDYNANADSDNGDEDGDFSIKGDTDDIYIGIGPKVFSGGVNELYLLSGDKKTRNLFRWNVKEDPDRPNGYSCNIDSDNIITGSGCIGTIEFLKLEGVDWGNDHDDSIIDSLQYDGVIDTWLIAKEFSGLDNTGTGFVIVAGSSNSYRKPLFPDTINVTNFKVFAYPSLSPVYSWADDSPEKNISDYVTISYSIKPSWKTRKRLMNDFKELKFNSTINLTDIYSK